MGDAVPIKMICFLNGELKEIVVHPCFDVIPAGRKGQRRSRHVGFGGYINLYIISITVGSWSIFPN